MKLTREQFKKLQKEWYELLAATGFKDIEKQEGSECVLIQTSSYCFRNVDNFCKEVKETYFRSIAQAAHDEETKFRNEIDRFILMRHAEGAKIKTIMTELIARGMGRNRDSIRYIIRRYEMAWGLRSYSSRELHRKKA